MRLIDADALKFKNVAEVNGILTHILTPEEIDNAPTVERVINMYPKGEVIVQNTRPQGEWVVYGRQGGIPITDKCSNCKYEMKWYKNKYNFCPNCGAKMQKGDVE